MPKNQRERGEKEKKISPEDLEAFSRRYQVLLLLSWMKVTSGPKMRKDGSLLIYTHPMLRLSVIALTKRSSQPLALEIRADDAPAAIRIAVHRHALLVTAFAVRLRSAAVPPCRPLLRCKLWRKGSQPYAHFLNRFRRGNEKCRLSRPRAWESALSLERPHTAAL